MLALPPDSLSRPTLRQASFSNTVSPESPPPGSRQNGCVRVRTAPGIAAVCVIALSAPAAFAQRFEPIGQRTTAQIVGGYKLFPANSCGDCHSFRAAGPTADGQVAMNFNHIHAPYQVAIAVITDGLPAGNPIFPTQMPHYGRVRKSADGEPDPRPRCLHREILGQVQEMRRLRDCDPLSASTLRRR